MRVARCQEVIMGRKLSPVTFAMSKHTSTINVSLPLALKKRMARCKGRPVWSQIAAAAFEKYLDAAEVTDSLTFDERLRRLENHLGLPR